MTLRDLACSLCHYSVICLCFPYIFYYSCVSIPLKHRRQARERRRAALHGIPGGEQRRRLSIGSPSAGNGSDRLLADAKGDGRAHDAKKKCSGNPIPSLFKSSRPRNSEQRTVSQDQSPFFNRLPPEIRLIIYQHILDCGRVHIVATPGKLVGIPCYNDHFSNGECAINQYNSVHCSVHYQFQKAGCVISRDSTVPVGLGGNFEQGVNGALALLRICRRVYIEAIDVLYSDRTFAISHLIGLMGLSISIPHQRFASITKLEMDGLSWKDTRSRKYEHYVPSIASSYFPPPEKMSEDPGCLPTAWKLICADILPRMASLVQLRISTDWMPPTAGDAHDIRNLIFLPPSRTNLPNIKVFEVNVHWYYYMRGRRARTVEIQSKAEEQGWAIPFLPPVHCYQYGEVETGQL